MNPLPMLAQALGLSYAAGINLYGTVLITGLAQRAGWIPAQSGLVGQVANTWVLILASVLFVIEFAATLVPGIASAWETFHTLIRPPAAAALAAGVAWHGNALLVLVAALLGGGLALTTHTTKLGLRYAIDTSPEPFTNGAANLAEMGLVTTIVVTLWHHPFIALAIAIAALVFLIATVRMIWRMLRRVMSGRWTPGCGPLQAARTSAHMHVATVPEDD